MLSGIIAESCDGYKVPVIIDPEQAIDKADYKKYVERAFILNQS